MTMQLSDPMVMTRSAINQMIQTRQRSWPSQWPKGHDHASNPKLMTQQVTLGSKWPLTQALLGCRGGGGGVKKKPWENWLFIYKKKMER